MHFILRAAVISLLLASPTALSQRRVVPEPDLILYKGVIWTVDRQKPAATAVAIRNGRLVAIGSDDAVFATRGRKTKLVNLHGAFVLPGINDNHTHFQSAARFLEFNIMRTSAQDEFVSRVRELAARLAPSEWITGGGWGAYDQWAEGSAGGARRAPFTPDIKLIEKYTASTPVFINKFDHSEYAVNGAAMKALGIDPANPSASGVDFLKDSAGKPSGIIRGKGISDLLKKVPQELSRTRRVQQTLNALAEIRRYGVVNISDMSDDTQLSIFEELRQKGQLTVRVHFRYPLDRWKELADRGIKIGSGDDWIRFGCLKGHIDGIMGNSTARFFEPYSNNPNERGRWRPLMADEKGNFVEGKFLKYMLDADRAGLQISVHAIGDEANKLLMDYVQEMIKQNGEKDRRFRLVHAQVVRPQDMHRFGELHMIAEVQPFHLSDDMRWMEERIGKERSRGAYAFRSLKDSGAILSFGTDWPGTTAAEYPINPLLGIYAAVTRQTVRGEPTVGWFPDQRLTVKEAIEAYTLGSAYANFEEQDKGSISLGKLADLTVLSKNLLTIPPSEYLATKVLYTIVDGKIVYDSSQKR